MLENGTQIGGYRIEGVLGHGGMGVVYEARQLSLGRIVALKVLARARDGRVVPRAVPPRGPIQAAIDHPHIVRVYEAGEWEGCCSSRCGSSAGRTSRR